MGFWEHEETFAGKAVVTYDPDQPLADPTKTIPRLVVEYDSGSSLMEFLSALVQDPQADQVTGLVIGTWTDEMFEAPPDEIVEALIAAAPQLPSLKALFFGDIISEECEVSWINLTDLSPFWEAFPQLEILKIRGGDGLSLGTIEHRHLRSLTIECGGLDREVLQAVAAADLPALEHLEIYLGDSGYGWNGTIEDLEPILSGKLFPKLKYLGLCDSEIADEVAIAVAKAPIVERLETLDLSQGTLGDAGAKALIASPAIGRLKNLNLSHHYISDKLQTELKKLPVKIDLSEQQDGDEDNRYVAISE